GLVHAAVPCCARWHKLEPLIVQDHRFLHDRAEPCLFGGGQLLQREAQSRKMWRLLRVMLLRATAASRPAMPARRKQNVLTPSCRPDSFPLIAQSVTNLPGFVAGTALK